MHAWALSRAYHTARVGWSLTMREKWLKNNVTPRAAVRKKKEKKGA